MLVSTREHAALLWPTRCRRAGHIPGIPILTIFAFKVTLKTLLKISKSFSLHGLHVLMSPILEMLRFKILINSLKVLLANSS